ncbi:hypothetical protein BSF_25200 [Bacillus subtilis]|nr:hypothetical protein BCV60_02365 [Bacillus halotolerans]BDG80791.1 hypothetical protein BSF_25200 [Bacillus subtilis]
MVLSNNNEAVYLKKEYTLKEPQLAVLFCYTLLLIALVAVFSFLTNTMIPGMIISMAGIK